MTAPGTTTGVAVFAAGLDDAAVAAELERRRARLAGVAAVAGATTTMLCWRVGPVRCAVPLATVRHVSGPVATTPLPGAAAAVVGVFARRGVIHTLFDPAGILGVGAGGGAGAVLLVRRERPFVAIRVDAVEGTIALPADIVAAALANGTVATPVVDPDAPVDGGGGVVMVVDMGGMIGQLTGDPAGGGPLMEG